MPKRSKKRFSARGPLTSLDRWLPIRVEELADEELVEEALSKPNLYELRNMASGHGMPVRLAGRAGGFWSRGFMGCEFGCGHALDDAACPMYVSEVRRNGVYTWRRGCRRIFE